VDFHERLKSALDWAGPEWSVRQLHTQLVARKVRGSSRTMIHIYLKGDKTPRPDWIESVAELLGVRRSWLQDGNGRMTESEEFSSGNELQQFYEKTWRNMGQVMMDEGIPTPVHSILVHLMQETYGRENPTPTELARLTRDQELFEQGITREEYFALLDEDTKERAERGYSLERTEAISKRWIRAFLKKNLNLGITRGIGRENAIAALLNQVAVLYMHMGRRPNIRLPHVEGDRVRYF